MPGRPTRPERVGFAHVGVRGLRATYKVGERVAARTRRWLIGLTAALASLALVIPSGSASAISFDSGSDGSLDVPTETACPTIETPDAFEAWLNVWDMEKRGFYDPADHTPWDFAIKTAQVVCGAKEGSEIKIGMYFIRALGTMTDTSLGDRPESDPEVIYDALEYVAKNRKVTVGLVLDGGTITPGSARNLINRRLLSIPGLKIYWCANGCFNTNAESVYPSAINHEKFLTISDTVWSNPAAGPHPAVLSTSGNFARSQIRNYWQEASLIYDDKKFFEAFDVRYDGMVNCAVTGCATDSGFPDALQLVKQRSIWVDPIYRHYTDAGRGTTVSFAPATYDARDHYVQQFDDVDCEVDSHIRIAMFKLTDSKAKQMADALVRVKKRGCDVSLILTSQGGATTISSTVLDVLKANSIPAKCSAVAMHTKMILIGPETNNNGRVLFGTANMSTSGLRYSEEHTVTLDTRRAAPAYVDSIRRVYGEYLEGFYELSRGAKSC